MKVVLMCCEIIIGFPFFVAKLIFQKLLGGWQAVEKYDNWVTKE